MNTPENMRNITKITPFCVLLGLLAVSPVPAQAAAIINLSNETKQVVLETADGGKVTDIAPGRRYFVPGKAAFRVNDRRVFIEHHEEYAIWPDGTFGPQRRMRSLYGL